MNRLDKILLIVIVASFNPIVFANEIEQKYPAYSSLKDENSKVTIGELQDRNEAKRYGINYDSLEGDAHKQLEKKIREIKLKETAKELGLDYKKMTEPPENVVDDKQKELSTQKRVNEVIANDPVLGKFALEQNTLASSKDIQNSKINERYKLSPLLLVILLLCLFFVGFIVGRKTKK